MMLKEIKEDLFYTKSKFDQPYLKTFFFNRGFHSLMFYRISNYLHRKKVPFIPLILTRLIQILYAIDIDYKCTIAGGVIIIHGVGVVIGEGAVISSNVIIYHGVTLGRKRQISGIDAKDGFPTVGERTVLGAGSKLIGGIKIGSGSIIGPNVVLMKDVPKNSIVKVQEPIINFK